jgi:hypothetical protein
MVVFVFCAFFFLSEGFAGIEGLRLLCLSLRLGVRFLLICATLARFFYTFFLFFLPCIEIYF